MMLLEPIAPSDKRYQPKDISRMTCFTAPNEAQLINEATQSADGGATA